MPPTPLCGRHRRARAALGVGVGAAVLALSACAVATVGRRQASPTRATDAPGLSATALARVAPDAKVQLSGRFAKVAGRPDCLRFAYGQSALGVRYRGPRPRLLLGKGDDNSLPVLFDVRLDGRAQGVRTLTCDGDDEEIAHAPPDGGDTRDDSPHVLQLVRRSEALMGEVWACGVALPAGTTLLPPAPAPARRMLFVGDSITAGYGNLGAGPHCPFTPAGENGSLAFAPLAAALLGADLEVVAWSGRGLWRNLDLSFEGTMPQLLARALPEDPHALWAAAAAPVDAVVINLGTNDFSGGRVDGEAFTAAYADFLRELRRLYPTAHLVASLGPMLQDSPPTPGALTQARANVLAAMSMRQRAGETPQTLSLLEFPRQDGSLGYGCDWHPSLATHRAMAERLAAHLRGLWPDDGGAGAPGETASGG